MITAELVAAIPDGKTLTVASGLRLFRRRELVQWQVKYYAGAKRQTKVLGLYPTMDTAAALEAAAKVRGGPQIQPTLKAQSVAVAVAAAIAAPVHTFLSVAREWMTHDDRKAPRTLKQHERLLGLLKPLHDRPITEITPTECRLVLEGIQNQDDKRHTAHRAKFVACNIFDHAQRHEIFHNPCARSKGWLKPFTTKHHPAIVDAAGFAALAIDVNLAALQGAGRVSNALRLLMYTVVRQGELIGATWGEFKDLDSPASARWEIPASRMKMKRVHVVPLSRQALDLVLQQRALLGGAPEPHKFVFPSMGNTIAGRHMAPSTLTDALNALGYKDRHTPHGFRASFSTQAHEAGKDHRLIEMCLAHQDGDKVSASYNSATQVAARRELMQWYADMIDSLTGA